MVKGISSINGIIKTGVISALIAGSTALYATNPAKKDTQPNQTEVVSKAGAEALKAISLQEIQQNSVPTNNNYKLDNMLKKFIESDEDKKYVEGILNTIYKEYGLFMGSALMQHEIDTQQFYAFMTKNTNVLTKNNINPELGKKIESFGSQFYEKITPHEKTLTNWVVEKYTPSVKRVLNNDNINTAKNVGDKIFKLVANIKGLSYDDLIQYRDADDEFIKQKGKTILNDADKADYAAFQMFMIDKLVLNNALKLMNIYSSNSTKYDDKNLEYYFLQWMDSVKPSAK